MDTLYQSLVAVNPVTLIAAICNLFLQLFVLKSFSGTRSWLFWISAVLLLTRRSGMPMPPKQRPCP